MNGAKGLSMVPERQIRPSVMQTCAVPSMADKVPTRLFGGGGAFRTRVGRCFVLASTACGLRRGGSSRGSRTGEKKNGCFCCCCSPNKRAVPISPPIRAIRSNTNSWSPPLPLHALCEVKVRIINRKPEKSRSLLSPGATERYYI